MYKRCPVKTNSLDMTPVRSQTSLNFLKKKGCEFCNEFQIDLLSYVLSRIERIIKQTNTVSYSVALNFCGSKICDFYVVFHYPLKTVPAKKKFRENILRKNFLHWRNYTYKNQTKNLVADFHLIRLFRLETKRWNVIADPSSEQSATQEHDVY